MDDLVYKYDKEWMHAYDVHLKEPIVKSCFGLTLDDKAAKETKIDTEDKVCI